MNKAVLRRAAAGLAATLALAAAALGLATWGCVQPFEHGLDVVSATPVKPRVLARDGTPLNLSLQNAWNVSDPLELARMPALLREAFLISEDARFYRHDGVDWLARLAAAWQDLRAGAAVRGASTITEQDVRMLHPRLRTLWSRWLEGFEAQALERRYSKEQLLAFYLNQVPYAERRRGVVQAARYYYDRDLDTLTPVETLSLAVLVRSPNGMDLRRNPQRLRRAVEALADRLVAAGKLPPEERERLRAQALEPSPGRTRIDAGYFVSHVLQRERPEAAANAGQIVSTLDPWLQSRTQQILDTALEDLARRQVHDGALLVIDHARNEILAWVVARARSPLTDPGAQGLGYDTVRVPRQPGSTMKPLLYGMALDAGWTAARLIDDSELSEEIRLGQHTFRNYSRVHYGPVRLREALGNSLNIPAVRTLRYVGVERFLQRLRALGVSDLARSAAFYGYGLALGNGEVSLYEMAQAYTALARRGRYLPLTATRPQPDARAETQVYSPEAASLIGDILSDPQARALEFGRGLQFPVQTAIKTGTSTDYRDAWAIAFDYRHTVAIWMGNLDGRPMDGVTGAIGPAMVLRTVFAELHRNQDTRGLWLSPRLEAERICRKTGEPADERCPALTEWFLPGTAPRHASPRPSAPSYRLLQPTQDLQVARDPRIPAELEALPMAVEAVAGLRRVAWYVDEKLAAETDRGQFAWPLEKGTHVVSASIWRQGESAPHPTPAVRFQVR